MPSVMMTLVRNFFTVAIMMIAAIMTKRIAWSTVTDDLNIRPALTSLTRTSDLDNPQPPYCR